MDLREVVGKRPLVMAGAGVIVRNKEGELLLQLRSDTKDWGLPGGALELGESLEDTARRELFEETGLHAEHFSFLRMCSGPEFYAQYPNGDEVYNVISVYEANGISGEFAMTDGESLDLRYFPLDDLPELNHITQKMLTGLLIP
ncbi:NUDIX hydrolase [Terribacillus sp. 179-K 1B1 HS]|uniref:NUDIX hydrolase n=1 Tax=Terribacillus sp. 179-K 1B1 HS TaxID=3142388 RepID=UPI0039A38E47